MGAKQESGNPQVILFTLYEKVNIAGAVHGQLEVRLQARGPHH